MLKTFKNFRPRIDFSTYIAENALIIGNVTLGPRTSIWPGVTIRGDINSIMIGEETNIQEQCLIHVDSDPLDQGRGSTKIGDRVTVGHGVILHGCQIGNDCLIGMGAIILTGAKVGEGSLIAAGALVRENQEIPARSLVMGIPASIKGTVSEEKLAHFRKSAKHYAEIAQDHRTLSKTVDEKECFSSINP